MRKDNLTVQESTVFIKKIGLQLAYYEPYIDGIAVQNNSRPKRVVKLS